MEPLTVTHFPLDSVIIDIEVRSPWPLLYDSTNQQSGITLSNLNGITYQLINSWLTREIHRRPFVVSHLNLISQLMCCGALKGSKAGHHQAGQCDIISFIYVSQWEPIKYQTAARGKHQRCSMKKKDSDTINIRPGSVFVSQSVGSPLQTLMFPVNSHHAVTQMFLYKKLLTDSQEKNGEWHEKKSGRQSEDRQCIVCLWQLKRSLIILIQLATNFQRHTFCDCCHVGRQ